MPEEEEKEEKEVKMKKSINRDKCSKEIQGK